MTDASAQPSLPLNTPAAPPAGVSSNSPFAQPLRPPPQPPEPMPRSEGPVDRFKAQQQESATTRDADFDRLKNRYADPSKAPDSGAAPAPPPASEKIRVGDAEWSPEEISAALQAKAAADVAAASRPTSPEGYELALPPDLTLPPGVSFEFNPDDPITGPVLQKAREFAHANGFTAQQWQGMLGLHASALAHEQAILAEAHRVEVAKMGAAGTARVDAVTRFLTSHLGDEIARPMIQTMVTERQVRGFETLIQKMSSQGASPFSQQHRETRDEGLSDAQYEALSWSEKREYARNAQRQNGRR